MRYEISFIVVKFINFVVSIFIESFPLQKERCLRKASTSIARLSNFTSSSVLQDKPIKMSLMPILKGN